MAKTTKEMNMKDCVKELAKIDAKDELTEKDMEKLDEIEESLSKMPKSKKKDSLLEKVKAVRDDLEDEEEDEDEGEEEEEDEDEDEGEEEEEDEDEDEEDEEEEEEKPKKKSKKGKGKKKDKKKEKKPKKGKGKKKGSDIPKGWKPSLKQYKRLATLAGVNRIGTDALEKVRKHNIKEVTEMMECLTDIAQNAGRETIKAKDVKVYIRIKRGK